MAIRGRRQPFAPIIKKELASSGTSYTLAADAGAFALSGQAATLGVGEAASAGSFALTGQPATFGVGLAGAAGAFSLTGGAAAAGVGLAGSAGAFTLAGQSATLTQTAGSYTLAAGVGVFSLAGGSAALTQTSTVTFTAPKCGRPLCEEGDGMSFNGGLVTGAVVGHSGVTLLARILGQLGQPITQASLSSVAYGVFDLTAGVQLGAGSLAPSACVFDALQQSDPRWTRDGPYNPGPDGLWGYNFLAVLPAALFPSAAILPGPVVTPQPPADRVQAEVVFTPASGEQFRAVWQWTPMQVFL